MKMNLFKYAVVASMLFGLASQSNAVNVAEAAGVMADLEALVVQAKEVLSKAAIGGDVDAIAEANRRSAAIDQAVAAGRQALADMEQSVAMGDEDSANAKMDELAAALSQANDALTGVLPEAAVAQADEWKESKENAGGGPGEAGAPPNIYDVPWKSQGIRAYYQSLFGHFHNASSFGHGKGFGDRDATPE